MSREKKIHVIDTGLEVSLSMKHSEAQRRHGLAVVMYHLSELETTLGNLISQAQRFPHVLKEKDLEALLVFSDRLQEIFVSRVDTERVTK